MTEIGPHPSGPGWVDRTDEEQIEALNHRVVELLRERDGYRAALEQVAIVCTDNMDRGSDHRMALNFVRQVANDAIEKGPSANE